MNLPSAISIILIFALALALNTRREKLSRENDALKERLGRLEAQYSQAVLKYFNEETGPSFENAPEWGPDHAAGLATFFKTETGQALQRRFQVVAGNQCVAGCQDAMHTTYAAGNGNGWSEACQWFLKLSRVTGVQATTHDETAPEDEAQVLERLSS